MILLLALAVVACLVAVSLGSMYQAERAKARKAEDDARCLVKALDDVRRALTERAAAAYEQSAQGTDAETRRAFAMHEAYLDAVRVVGRARVRAALG